MSQTLLAAIGVGVFAVTLIATLLYGRFKFGQMYEAAAVEETTYVSLPNNIEVDVALGSAVPANKSSSVALPSGAPC